MTLTHWGLCREYFIFGGGMPRASFGDKEVVSIIFSNSEENLNREKNHVLDFTSKVVDFLIIYSGSQSMLYFASLCNTFFCIFLLLRWTHSWGVGCPRRRRNCYDRSIASRLAPVQVALSVLPSFVSHHLLAALFQRGCQHLQSNYRGRKEWLQHQV